MKHTITHGSLFSGIGGAELAATWMGWENKFHCEINEFGRTVLDYWFPNSESYEDITKTDFTKWRGKINVLTGGFPCQPFSLAGRRKGAEDDRYLWPHMLRAIREIQPNWVVGENVNGIITMVQPGEETQVANTDNIFDKGYIYRKVQRYTLDEICESLEREGYEVQPLVIPACAVGAPHRRDRVWIVARRIQSDATDTQCHGHSAQGHGHQRTRQTQLQERQDEPLTGTAGHGLCRPSADTDFDRLRFGTHQQESVSERCGTSDTCQGCEDGLVANSYGERHPASQTCARTQGVGSNPVPKSQEWSEPTQRTDGLPQLSRIISDSFSEGLERMHHSGAEEAERQCLRRDSSRPSEEDGRMGIPSDTAGFGLQEVQHEHGDLEASQEETGRPEQVKLCGADCPQDWWRDFPTQSPVRRGDDGIPFDVHGLSISFPKWCQESIKAYGNAWVPQVAYEIFRAIQITNDNDDEQ